MGPCRSEPRARAASTSAAARAETRRSYPGERHHGPRLPRRHDAVRQLGDEPRGLLGGAGRPPSHCVNNPPARVHRRRGLRLRPGGCQTDATCYFGPTGPGEGFPPSCVVNAFATMRAGRSTRPRAVDRRHRARVARLPDARQAHGLPDCDGGSCNSGASAGSPARPEQLADAAGLPAEHRDLRGHLPIASTRSRRGRRRRRRRMGSSVRRSPMRGPSGRRRPKRSAEGIASRRSDRRRTSRRGAGEQLLHPVDR